MTPIVEKVSVVSDLYRGSNRVKEHPGVPCIPVLSIILFGDLSQIYLAGLKMSAGDVIHMAISRA